MSSSVPALKGESSGNFSEHTQNVDNKNVKTEPQSNQHRSDDLQDPTKDKNDSVESVPFKEKFGYGAGAFCNQFGEGGINAIATPIYNLVLGLNITTIGLILGAIRLWDAVSDPIVGKLSDNCKSKLGRRRPFILLGTVLMAITYPLVWYASPAWTQHMKTFYFLALAIIFFTSYTIFSVPFRALGTELTPDYGERTAISVFSAFSTKGFYFMLPWILPLSQIDYFENQVTGVRVVTAACSILILITGFLCFKYPKERYQKVAAKQEEVQLFKSLKNLVKDKCFLSLHGMGLGLLCSTMLVEAMGMYINLFYVWAGDTKSGFAVSAIAANITQVLGIIILICLKKYFMHMDKKTLIVYALLLALVGSAAKWFLFTPSNPYLILIMPIFFAPSYTALWTLFMSMLGDYCDYDEHKNGKRREGVFSSASGWVMKAGGSAAVGVSGFILAATGFNKDLGGDQSDTTFLMMRLLFIGLPATCFVLSLICTKFYPLDRSYMARVRKDLEERRGSI
jgi:GPH family glycoside/pentoside/hexuronide:cation symporter